jgi:hypothetical protein
VERLTGLQVTVFTPDESLCLRAPLFAPLARTERSYAGFWLLDDMLLRVHPALIAVPIGQDETVCSRVQPDPGWFGAREDDAPADEPLSTHVSRWGAPPPEPDTLPTLIERGG